jgi:peptidoglycan hydrolase-like protein with peptidoglycan-binding domain
MAFKRITGAAVMTAMLMVPVGRAHAGDEFVGGLVGGLIGGAIGSGIANQQRQKAQTRSTRTRTVYVQPRATSAQRQEAREIQTSLNYFGFNAGAADGVLGGQSRAAISRYQGYMGYPATGQLSEYEKTMLLGAYHRALAGGAEVNQIIAKSNEGARAVLIAQRDGTTGTRTTGYAGLPMAVSEAVDEVADSSDPSAEQLLQRSGFIQLADLNGDGSTDYIIDTALAGSSFWCNASQCKTMVFASTSDGYRRNDLLLHSPTPASFDCIGGTCQVKAAPAAQPEANTMMAKAEEPETGATAGLTLPVFNTAPKQKSLSSHCSKVNLLTSANGGFTTVADVSNPDFALSEQLCLTRTYAVARGEDIMASVQGASQAAIEQQCDSFGQSMAVHVGALNAKPPKAVLNDVSGLVLDSGMTPEQLRTTAQICMASGYQSDKMAPALGGALLLTALGERPYAELVGHHLHGGFGTEDNADMALAWYEVAISALDGGAAPVFAPSQADRVEVLRKAALGLAGGDVAMPVPASSTGSSMPVFTLSE